jgi:hypothetical protein
MRPLALIAILLSGGCGFTYGTKLSPDAAPFSYKAWGGDSGRTAARQSATSTSSQARSRRPRRRHPTCRASARARRLLRATLSSRAEAAPAATLALAQHSQHG